MNKIKFSHNYKKISDTNFCILLDVIEVNLEDLSKKFLDYDTDDVYKLPKKGKYLMLIFQKEYIYINNINKVNNIFTTLRRYIPEKSQYYKSKIGEIFEVILNERV